MGYYKERANSSFLPIFPPLAGSARPRGKVYAWGSFLSILIVPLLLHIGPYNSIGCGDGGRD